VVLLGRKEEDDEELNPGSCASDGVGCCVYDDAVFCFCFVVGYRWVYIRR